MTHGQLKGTLLEYVVRRLLSNCGFTSVNPDGHYIFAQAGSGLFFINGKGAAHDADVLMEPPIQMPFSYPSRLLFECKSYETTIGLGVIRNALGLRYDINEFEIVDDASIQLRKNNRRANYAISNRKRYNYQVGVAAVSEFSKPAFEFAANNKIPLISLRWFLPDVICNLFHTITTAYCDSIQEDLRELLYSFLKDKNTNTWNMGKYSDVIEFMGADPIIGEIVRNLNSVIGNCFVGLIETGDLIFLFATEPDSFELLQEQIHFNGLQARIHYHTIEPDVWYLEIINDNHLPNQRNPEFRFHVPRRIISQWQNFSLDRTVAIDMKQQFFSRIFIFTGMQGTRNLPFFLLNIDQQWLDNVRGE